MRSEGSAQKRWIGAVVGVIAAVLAGASFAWACTEGNESLAVSPDVAAPGDTVEISGQRWVRGTVDIFLANGDLRINLAKAVPIETPATSGQPTDNGWIPPTKVTLPTGLTPGLTYNITVTHSNGITSDIGTATVFVENPVQTVPNTPRAPTSSTGGPNREPAPAPAPAEAATPTADADPAPAPAVIAAVDAAAAQADPAPAPAVAAEPSAVAAPVAEEAWSGVAQPGRRSPQPSLVDGPGVRSGSGAGLLVGAGLLAVGSVALFGGFTVALARRRRASAYAGADL